MKRDADFTYVGTAIDDSEIFAVVPPDLRSVLGLRNGFVCFDGGLHIRGAVMLPAWHSLREAWWGPTAFHRLYDEVDECDIPFAEDCVGDQFLLRGGEVVRLRAGSGNLDNLGLSLPEFLARCAEDSVELLEMEPLVELRAQGASLQPGQLVHAYPPFCTREADAGVSLRAVAAHEVHAFHARLANAIRTLPDSASVNVAIE